MSQILDLREKRAKAWDAAKQFLDAKRGADGMLSEEDTATYDKMEQDVMNLGKEIERLERQAAIDAELSRLQVLHLPESRVQRWVKMKLKRQDVLLMSIRVRSGMR